MTSVIVMDVKSMSVMNVTVLFNSFAKRILNIHKIESLFGSVYQYYHKPFGTMTMEFIRDRNKANKDPDFIDLEEGLTPQDALALEVLAREVACQEVMFAEIGTWKGKSASILASVAKPYNGLVFCIDHWKGNKNSWCEPIAQNYDVYSIFRQNMELLDYQDTVKAMVMESNVASQVFADGKLSLVFIDGDHYYKNIARDLVSWYPKLKQGGIICGHDIDAPDVYRACLDYLPEFQICEGTGIWYYKFK